eukprot:comp14876_c1_seq1/m.21888 comp14876_c1_seq1/g.21888  ORF comp14876_c1_seq1/g.21888 comp14876_c1_seq1/m.21888 type:complete len:456 (+) comp14876_c1_seq1:168-1535(+)
MQILLFGRKQPTRRSRASGGVGLRLNHIARAGVIFVVAHQMLALLARARNAIELCLNLKTSPLFEPILLFELLALDLKLLLLIEKDLLHLIELLLLSQILGKTPLIVLGTARNHPFDLAQRLVVGQAGLETHPPCAALGVREQRGTRRNQRLRTLARSRRQEQRQLLALVRVDSQHSSELFLGQLDLAHLLGFNLLPLAQMACDLSIHAAHKLGHFGRRGLDLGSGDFGLGPQPLQLSIRSLSLHAMRGKQILEIVDFRIDVHELRARKRELLLSTPLLALKHVAQRRQSIALDLALMQKAVDALIELRDQIRVCTNAIALLGLALAPCCLHLLQMLMQTVDLCGCIMCRHFAALNRTHRVIQGAPRLLDTRKLVLPVGLDILRRLLEPVRERADLACALSGTLSEPVLEPLELESLLLKHVVLAAQLAHMHFEIQHHVLELLWGKQPIGTRSLC